MLCGRRANSQDMCLERDKERNKLWRFVPLGQRRKFQDRFLEERKGTSDSFLDNRKGPPSRFLRKMTLSRTRGLWMRSGLARCVRQGTYQSVAIRALGTEERVPGSLPGEEEKGTPDPSLDNRKGPPSRFLREMALSCVHAMWMNSELARYVS